MKVWVGIDPGVTGAIAILTGPGIWQIDDMPTIEVGKHREVDVGELVELFRDFPFQEYQVQLVAIERQQAMPGQGLSSTFKTAQGYGVLLGVVTAVGLPLMCPRPMDWKRAMRLGKGKDAARDMARKRWPSHSAYLRRKQDHGRAEAMLLAEWAREQAEVGARAQ